MILVVPSLDEPDWPTLGPQVCAWMEKNLVFGPGDLLGEPAKLDDEKRAFLYRAYQIWPEGSERAGRRRFKRAAFSRRKGIAKTELAAWIAAAELHPSAPVRCNGWRKSGTPIARGVTDPYLPLVAVTEQQTDDTIYGALYEILRRSPAGRAFNVEKGQIVRVGGDGKAVALASEPNARDGAKTTFVVFEETHRWTSERLRKAYQSIMAALPKRKASDCWSLEVTTAPAPGERSIAEATHSYALAVHEGRIKNTRMFYSHRQAADSCDLTTPEGIRAAVLEASGECAAQWSDIDGICEQFNDPNSDLSYLRRVYLNQQEIRSADKAFDLAAWDALASPGAILPGSLVTLGFDGARTRDATALVACDVVTGKLQLVGCWERPVDAPEGWRVPEAEVRAAVDACFVRWNVWRMNADPFLWELTVDDWAGQYNGVDEVGRVKVPEGKRVVAWSTNKYHQMAFAVQAFVGAIANRHISHDGNITLRAHLSHAYRRLVQLFADDGSQLWIIQKASADSPLKIDAGMAAILAVEGRRAAIALGAGQPAEQSGYNARAERGEDPVRMI